MHGIGSVLLTIRFAQIRVFNFTHVQSLAEVYLHIRLTESDVIEAILRHTGILLRVLGVLSTVVKKLTALFEVGAYSFRSVGEGV